MTGKHSGSEPQPKDKTLAIVALMVAAAIAIVVVTMAVYRKPTPLPTVTATATAIATTTIIVTGPPADNPTAPPIATKPAKTVLYTIEPGDNLTSIAARFKQAGWNPLYSWNTTAIGRNPNLIRPGVTIVVSVSG
jgi:nucleoid-associated protein YgaU